MKCLRGEPTELVSQQIKNVKTAVQPLLCTQHITYNTTVAYDTAVAPQALDDDVGSRLPYESRLTDTSCLLPTPFMFVAMLVAMLVPMLVSMLVLILWLLRFRVRLLLPHRPGLCSIGSLHRGLCAILLSPPQIVP